MLRQVHVLIPERLVSIPEAFQTGDATEDSPCVLLLLEVRLYKIDKLNKCAIF